MKIVRCDEKTLKDLRALVLSAKCPDGLTADAAIGWGMRIKACEAVLTAAREEDPPKRYQSPGISESANAAEKKKEGEKVNE